MEAKLKEAEDAVALLREEKAELKMKLETATESSSTKPEKVFRENSTCFIIENISETWYILFMDRL